MIRPVVIVDPLSSGIELAPAFKARGIPCIAVIFKPLERIGFGTKVQVQDFVQIIEDQPNLEEILRAHNPLAVIPGSESAVPLAERLAEALTPHLANDPGRAAHRLHKALMQQALEEAEVPTLKTLNASSEKEVEDWISEHKLEHIPLIIKPPVSAGSDKVFHIPVGADWRRAFNRVLTEPSKITTRLSESVVVQEQALGTEYAVGTVSAGGQHYLAHLIRYTKASSEDRKTVFDHVEFIAFEKESHGELFEYTKRALDALGVRWGAAHTEIMLTEAGPRLIESGARMLGGPTVGFAREASGSSQADRLVEVYTTGDVLTKEYQFKKTVVPVFLRSPVEGIISNVEALDGISELETLLNKYVWLKNGERVPQTVDYLTATGIVALSGNRKAIFEDYGRIRLMESQLSYQDCPQCSSTTR